MQKYMFFEEFSSYIMKSGYNSLSLPVEDVMSQKENRQKPIKVLLLGTGYMGRGIAKIIGEKQGMDIVAAVDANPQIIGKDLGQLMGLPKSNIEIEANLQAALENHKPDVVVQATASRVSEAIEGILTSVEHGAFVISTAEEMSFPFKKQKELSQKIDAAAKRNNVAVMGTGINPGFVLDYLILALSSVCAHVESIIASRVNDLSPYGPAVLSTQGVGLSEEAFNAGIKDGTVVGHFGFPESIHMIAESLGWNIDRIEEIRKPIISNVERKTESITIAPGETAGCEHIGIGYEGDKERIKLIHPQQVHPQLEGVETSDRIQIFGTPNITIATDPEIPGGIGTEAIIVNTIPRLLELEPGLRSMIDVKVPACLPTEMKA
jgi:hypothetical protein